jgi:hypothetical protein
MIKVKCQKLQVPSADYTLRPNYKIYFFYKLTLDIEYMNTQYCKC